MKKLLILLLVLLPVSLMSAEKTFTAKELAQFDGQNGRPAYVAVDGVVYDVTGNKAWKDGKHKNGVTAGKDLSSEIDEAPHMRKVLPKLPVVGTLK